MLLFSIISAVIAGVLAIFAKMKVPAWQARDFGDRNFKWNLLIAISTVMSIALGNLAFFLSHNVWTSASISILSFVVVLASVVDFALLKIPHEMTTVLIVASLPFIPLLWPSFDFYDQMTMMVWSGIIVMFFILCYLRMFGWADVKLLFAFGTLLSWWVEPVYMMYAFLGSSLLALAALPLTKRLGYGVKKTLKEHTKWDADEKKLVAVNSIPEDELDGLNRKQVRKKRGKKKTFLPFGPALLVSYLVMALIASATISANTYTWWG